MSAAVEIRPIPATGTHGLRRDVLRHGSTDPVDLDWAHDHDADTLHVGAFVDGEIHGIATVHREPPPWDDSVTGWRLRGMATSASRRGSGLGRLLLERVFEHVRAHGDDLLWCNARTGAVPFYERLGLQVRGEEFDIPGVGPHYVMWISL